MVNLSEGYNYSSALEDESLYKIYKEYGEKKNRTIVLY